MSHLSTSNPLEDYVITAKTFIPKVFWAVLTLICVFYSFQDSMFVLDFLEWVYNVEIT